MNNETTFAFKGPKIWRNISINTVTFFNKKRSFDWASPNIISYKIIPKEQILHLVVYAFLLKI